MLGVKAYNSTKICFAKRNFFFPLVVCSLCMVMGSKLVTCVQVTLALGFFAYTSLVCWFFIHKVKKNRGSLENTVVFSSFSCS